MLAACNKCINQQGNLLVGAACVWSGRWNGAVESRSVWSGSSLLAEPWTEVRGKYRHFRLFY